MTQHQDIGGPAQPLLIVKNLLKHFPLKASLFRRGAAAVQAVDDISFDVMKNETLGIVGESGCGKSTTARLLLQLLQQDRGELIFDGQTVGSTQLPMKSFRRQVQMVFQDSYSSLNPRMTILDTIAFAPIVHGMPPRQAEREALELLENVGLDPQRYAGRYPHELSGGQRQRVNIARAIALKPRLIILDEAVSALDKSVEAQVLNLLSDLKKKYNLTFVFISHDLSVIEYLCDRVLVMYLGKVVELGATRQVLNTPAHPYTQALLASVPTTDPDRRTEKAPLAGDPPNPIEPPSGCRFHPRCSQMITQCKSNMPLLLAHLPGHQVACIRVNDRIGQSVGTAQQESADMSVLKGTP
nr:ABC transporter ATP-binding protein [Advenella sp. FME57]